MNQIAEFIKEKEKEAMKIVGGYCWFESGGNGGYSEEDVQSFLHQFAIELVEKVGEEIIGEDEDLFSEAIRRPDSDLRNELRRLQRSKLKKIIMEKKI